MAYQQNDNVTALLMAEKRASEKIAEAHANRNKRIKEANSEAEAEVAAFAAERENIYQGALSQQTGSRSETAKKLEAETATKIASIEAAVSTKLDDVVTLLVDLVKNVQPQKHINDEF